MRRSRREASDRSVWPGAAFVMEALILLLFLATCLAVFMRLFADSNETGVENLRMEEAIVLATNEAERFAANPEGAAADPGAVGGVAAAEGTLSVSCNVTPEATAAGTLYRAEIVVSDGDGEVYRLVTARYVSGASAGAGAGAAAAAESGVS